MIETFILCLVYAQGQTLCPATTDKQQTARTEEECHRDGKLLQFSGFKDEAIAYFCAKGAIKAGWLTGDD